MEKPPASIGSRIASGAFWTVGMRFGVRGLGVISIIILARILVPEDFGIVAKASMIASFLELITRFGLEAALIQNQAATNEHYDTVWTVHAIRGAIIAAVLVLVAYPAADFFREAALGEVLFVYALAALIRGFINIGTVDFQKDLEFHKDFRFNLYGKLVGFVTTIIIAIIWQTYWAFAIGVLAAALTKLATSFVMSSYRPGFSLAQWRSLFDFSKWVFTAGLINAVSDKLDTFILSRFSTTETVGQYTVAKEISGIASTEVAMPIARATMPGLSKLNSDQDEYRSTYTASMLVLLFIVVPTAVGISAVSEPLTALVLGQKWMAAAPFIEILAFFGIARAVFAISKSAYVSSGRIDVFAKLTIVHLILRVLLLSAGYYWGGVTGLAWGVLIAAVLQMFVTSAAQHFLALLHVGELLRHIWRVLAAAATMYICLKVIWPLVHTFADELHVLALLSEVTFGATVYFVTLSLFWLVSRDWQGPEVIILRFLKQRLAGRGGAT